MKGVDRRRRARIIGETRKESIILPMFTLNLSQNVEVEAVHLAVVGVRAPGVLAG